MPENVSRSVISFKIGFCAGLRSMTPLAAVVWGKRHRNLRLPEPLSPIGSEWGTLLVTICTAGELIADKLPFTPNRTQPGSLIVRSLTGAIAGASLGAGETRGAKQGAVLGALGGLAGSFAGYEARRRLVQALSKGEKSTRVTLAVALGEDALAIGASLWLVSQCLPAPVDGRTEETELPSP